MHSFEKVVSLEDNIRTMKISWLGHSCFILQSSAGIKVLTDPFDEEVGYPLPNVEADIVLVSHDHHDHNNAKIVKGHPLVIKRPGTHEAFGMNIKGVKTYHDENEGKLRGTNTIFCFSLDNVRVCHLGDLGHVLGADEIKAIGPVDLLLIPVGAIYTLDAIAAQEVVMQIRPHVAVPMHYYTTALRFKLDPVDKFLQGCSFDGPQDSLELKGEAPAETGTRIVLLSIISPDNLSQTSSSMNPDRDQANR
ncbi:MAG: MBL fold metallo-hydrolase [Methanotrichaceae archaeon]|nr:MBL fold metallo-hydrolase [Methanotrichaceae archaeon]